MEDFAKALEKLARPGVDNLKTELSGIRTNRPHPQLVEDIKVNYLDQQLSIKQLGSISIVPPREIDINVWDKGAMEPVMKAIETSGRGLTANSDGNLIRIYLPTLTDERRQELTKVVKNLTEQVKIRIRTLRDDTNKKIESAFKAKMLSEDQKFKAKEQVQKTTDKLNAEVELLLAGKIKEITE
jgi:ribosome recycling factor